MTRCVLLLTALVGMLLCANAVKVKSSLQLDANKTKGLEAALIQRQRQVQGSVAALDSNLETSVRFKHWMSPPLWGLNLAQALSPCNVILYEHCFSGYEYTFQDGGYVLHEMSLGDKVSSMKVQGSGCVATLWEHAENNGRSYTFTEGEYDCQYFSQAGQHDSASWIRVFQDPCSVTLYEHCFAGNEYTFRQGGHDLHEGNLGDKASSIRVQGSGCFATLWEHAENNGRSWTFTEGDYNCEDFQEVAHHDSASAMRVLKDPCNVILYEHCFFGHEWTFQEGGHNLLDMHINDKASSIRVQGSGCVATLYQQHFEQTSKNFRRSWSFKEGEYNCEAFGQVGIHDSATFMRVSSTITEHFDEKNYTRSATFQAQEASKALALATATDEAGTSRAKAETEAQEASEAEANAAQVKTDMEGVKWFADVLVEGSAATAKTQRMEAVAADATAVAMESAVSSMVLGHQ